MESLQKIIMCVFYGAAGLTVLMYLINGGFKR